MWEKVNGIGGVQNTLDEQGFCLDVDKDVENLENGVDNIEIIVRTFEVNKRQYAQPQQYVRFDFKEKSK